MNKFPDLNLSSLRAAYKSGEWTPTKLITELRKRISQDEPNAVWIHLLEEDELTDYTKAIENESPDTLPLYGVPFAIKDNIDLKGAPTTAACPDSRYAPEQSAFVVTQLIRAGAIPIGKTNMDQFATGLVGTRSPYGSPDNAYHADYISGGSSSGSAVAVANQFVCFALGTDTAGSGRVPAAFNHLVGHKPTKGLLSTSGIVPACRSLDCVSIFSQNAGDCTEIFKVAAVFDPNDPYARDQTDSQTPLSLNDEFTFGVPKTSQLEFFGDTESAVLFLEFVERLKQLGGQEVEIDFSPFLEAARLLYEGPWVAERYIAIKSILTDRPEILHPITREIIAKGSEPTAAEAFQAEYRLKELKRIADETFTKVDLALTPTTGTIYTKKEIEADPITLNSNLGYYTNFMNLLDYSATAIPGGFRVNGTPFGSTIFAPAFHDTLLLHLSQRLEARDDEHFDESIPEGWTPLVVCGAHLSGLALNWQLTDRDARLWKTTQSAPVYEFYALPPVGDTIPPRPGMVRVEKGGQSIAVEVWLIPTQNLGSFVANIPEPLGIGKVQVKDGTFYSGFICEGFAVENAQNITKLADWRKYLKTL